MFTDSACNTSLVDPRREDAHRGKASAEMSSFAAWLTWSKSISAESSSFLPPSPVPSSKRLVSSWSKADESLPYEKKRLAHHPAVREVLPLAREGRNVGRLNPPSSISDLHPAVSPTPVSLFISSCTTHSH